MANRKFSKVHTPDATINRIQDAVAKGTTQQSTIGKGRQINRLSFAAGVPQNVPHKLARTLQGAQVGTNSGGARFTITPSRIDPKKYVTIEADVNTVADLWVF